MKTTDITNLDVNSLYPNNPFSHRCFLCDMNLLMKEMIWEKNLNNNKVSRCFCSNECLNKQKIKDKLDKI